MDDYVPPQYTPVALVKAAHNIPHFDKTFSASDSSFAIYDNGNINQTYLIGVLMFPCVIMVLGILSIIIYQLTLCFRFCCQCCCKTCNSFQPMMTAPDDKTMFCCRIAKYKPVLIGFFYLSLVCAVASNFCMYMGHNYLDKSFSSGYDSLIALADVMNNVITSTNGLIANSNEMSAMLDSQACSEVFDSNDDANAKLSNFNSSSSGISGVVGSYPHKIEHAADIFIQYRGQMNEVLYIYFGFILFVILLHVVLTCCRSKVFLNILIAFTELIVLTLTIVAGLEMVLVMLFGDFCMDPATNAINIITGSSGSGDDDGSSSSGSGSSGSSGNSSSTNILTYYLQCQGTNQFIDPLHNATSALLTFNDTVYAQVQSARAAANNQSLGTVCLREFQSSIVDVIGSLGNITRSVECKPVYEVWDMAVNTSFCNYAFSGIFTVWLAHLITAGFLYFMLIEVSWFHELYHADKVQVHMEPVPADAAAADDKIQYGEPGGRDGGDIEMAQVVAPLAVEYHNQQQQHEHEHEHDVGHRHGHGKHGHGHGHGQSDAAPASAVEDAIAKDQVRVRGEDLDDFDDEAA